jgi:hypothetical protein
MKREGKVSSLKEEALAACRAALAELGFTRHKGALIQKRSGQASGWIGLNMAARDLPRLLKINPVVGVRFAHLEEIMLQLRDDLPKKPMPVTSKPLGYLMPEKAYRAWDFVEGGDHERVAQSLAAAVRDYGEPYIAVNANWDTFSRAVGGVGFLVEHERAKILPVVRVINGDREEGRYLVESELGRIADSDDVYAQSYRSFAARFGEMFG